MERCLKPFVSQVKGARMSDSNTPGIPEKKDVTFKIVDGKSLGHVHSIFFWNDKQVRIFIILTLLTGVFPAASHQLLEQDPAPRQQGTGHAFIPDDHRRLRGGQDPAAGRCHPQAGCPAGPCHLLLCSGLSRPWQAH